MNIGPFLFTRGSILAAISSASLSTVMSLSVRGSSHVKIIDSHLHVWANSEETRFLPYFQDPPDSLKERASAFFLIREMEAAGVDGALIVQPSNHKFDHSYVNHVIQTCPDRFKGMMLFDPSLSEIYAMAQGGWRRRGLE